MTAFNKEQLALLKETATIAVNQGHPEQNYWARVALQLIEEVTHLTESRAEWIRETMEWQATANRHHAKLEELEQRRIEWAYSPTGLAGGNNL